MGIRQNERGTWLCKCGRKLKQRKGSGWSNLYAHIEVQNQQKSETVVNNLPDQPTLSHPIYGIVSKKSSKFVWFVGLGVYGTQAIRVELVKPTQRFELHECCAAKGKTTYVQNNARFPIDETPEKFPKLDPETKFD